MKLWHFYSSFFKLGEFHANLYYLMDWHKSTQTQD